MNSLLGIPDAEILALLDAGVLSGYRSPISNDAYFHPEAHKHFKARIGSFALLAGMTYSKAVKPSIENNLNNFDKVDINKVVSKTDIFTPISDVPANPLVSDSNFSSHYVKHHEDLLTVEYLRQFNAKTKAVAGYPGLSLRKNKNSLVVIFRTKAANERLEIMSFKQGEDIQEINIITIKNAYKRFRLCLENGHPWHNKHYLLEGQKREIRTFNQLLNLYAEQANTALKCKIVRLQKRYFAGALGERLLSTYCHDQFVKDFLNVSNPDRKPSDRNEVVKIISAACNLAKDSANISIDVQNLAKSTDRNYADVTDKTMPTIGVFDSFLNEAYRKNDHRLCMSLLLQFFVSTRKFTTNHLTWEQVNIEDNFIEVSGHINKNRKFVRLAFPSFLSPLLQAYKKYLMSDPKVSKGKNGQPIYLFESSRKIGHAISSFDTHFNGIRSTLLSRQKSLSQHSDDSTQLGKAIRKFTQHRIRDLVDMQLLSVGATENQKEKAAGRTPSAVARAYEDLSLDKIESLKSKVFNQMQNEMPNFKRLFEGLLNNFSR